MEAKTLRGTLTEKKGDALSETLADMEPDTLRNKLAEKKAELLVNALSDTEVEARKRPETGGRSEGRGTSPCSS